MNGSNNYLTRAGGRQAPRGRGAARPLATIPHHQKAYASKWNEEMPRRKAVIACPAGMSPVEMSHDKALVLVMYDER
jgi:hypothetical protein